MLEAESPALRNRHMTVSHCSFVGYLDRSHHRIFDRLHDGYGQEHTRHWNEIGEQIGRGLAKDQEGSLP